MGKARDLANLLADGAVGTSEIADGAVTSGKLASGAAAANLGGSFVSSFNGQTGAVNYTAPVTSVNGQTGAVTISATPTTDQVLTATAGASEGAVGTYALLATVNSTTVLNQGGTIAGSSLRYAGLRHRADVGGTIFLTNSTAPSGTWRCMGYKDARVSNDSGNREGTMFLRIS